MDSKDDNTLFAEVLLPLPIPGTFTYRIPRDKEGDVSPGLRVSVQFGRKKIYAGLVTEVHNRLPSASQVKYILDILDKKAVVHENQLKFWRWMSEYYMSTLGEAMNVALPSGLKLASESRIILENPENINLNELSEKEGLIVEALLNQDTLTIDEISDIVQQKKVLPLINTLLAKSVIRVQEEIRTRYKPKIEAFVRFTQEYSEEEKIKEIFDDLGKKAYRQLQILVSYINLSRNGQKGESEVRRTELLKSVDGTHAQINGLVKKEIFEIYHKEVDRLPGNIKSSSHPNEIELTKKQEQALAEIKDSFKEKDVCLLHGVTSSGKTEIYIKLIQDTIDKGQQVLYLLPEIALTTQIIRRLQKYFGSKISVFHSKFNENERVETWNKVSGDTTWKNSPIVLGARSSLFLPFRNLGLVIIDEENDNSYKQYDPSPRYNARDSAIYLASLFKAKTLLGSATPSFESLYNCGQDKFGYVALNERYGKIELPVLSVVDLRKDHLTNKRKSHFSSILVDAVKVALDNKEQTILFQNRRGFSPHLECHNCGYIPMCIHCDISLTYHKFTKNIRCHYCGYQTGVPSKCPECGSSKVFMKGFGTEKIEEELSIFFPEAKVRRMDYDTTRTKHSHQHIINDFEAGNIDILVGTQMITKGLDFDNVSLVGIMNADNMINFPDFRSYERSFQMLTQVSGRSGRKHKRGKVLIQTYNPEHAVLQHLLHDSFNSFYKQQLEERQNFRYPPYYRLIIIKIKQRDIEIVKKASFHLKDNLSGSLGNRVLGPEFPLVSRIKNQYIMHILVKLEKNASVSYIKQKIQEGINELNEDSRHKRVLVQVDVDPV